MNIEKIQINKLKPATYNPRQITTKQYKDLKSSVEKFGLVDPIIINKKCYTIIGGHQRYRICKELKHKEIDCVVLDLSKEEERELNIRLNKNTGDFDMDILANEFDIDELVDWGFKHIDLDINIDKITEGNTEDDHIPEVKESRVKLGDVWELGKHRLMCGDSTKESDVEKLMNGEKADMVFTDPPYGMGFNAEHSFFGNEKIKAGKKHNNIINDDKEFNPTLIFKKFDYCKDILLFGADYYSDLIPNKNNGSWLIWDKRVEERYDNIIGSAFETIFSKRKIKRDIIRYEYVSWANRMKDKVNGIKPHPTMKPVKMLSILLKKFKHIKVVDLFLGSGSTLIACEKTNRICYGMELDTKYCDVIIERWEQFTGQKATKL